MYAVSKLKITSKNEKENVVDAKGDVEKTQTKTDSKESKLIDLKENLGKTQSLDSKKVSPSKDEKNTSDPNSNKVDPYEGCSVKQVEVDDEGKKFKGYSVPRYWACQVSQYVKEALAVDDKADKIPVECTETQLESVVSFIEKCRGTEMPRIPQPLASKDLNDVMPKGFEWGAKFINDVRGTGKEVQKKQDLHALTLLANKLGMVGLLYLACAKTASVIKGQALEKVKQFLDISKPDPEEVQSDSKASDSKGKSLDTKTKAADDDSDKDEDDEPVSKKPSKKDDDDSTRYRDWETDRKSTRLNSSHSAKSRMPSSA